MLVEMVRQQALPPESYYDPSNRPIPSTPERRKRLQAHARRIRAVLAILPSYDACGPVAKR